MAKFSVAGLNFKIEREPAKVKEKAEWERLKTTVDRIFEVKNADRT